jgi:hypothetical protein
MIAHGFKIELLLVHAGLATASTERMLASGRSMEVPACGSEAPAGGR